MASLEKEQKSRVRAPQGAVVVQSEPLNSDDPSQISEMMSALPASSPCRCGSLQRTSSHGSLLSRARPADTKQSAMVDTLLDISVSEKLSRSALK